MSAWMTDAVPDADQARREEADNLAVRLTLSHMLLPVPGQGDVSERVTRAVCAVLND
ncbi:hypothetical protein [Streptomyces sp. SS1-1]|uniref:hypothetical protein n=1 Tax=Streptomyces sp. SS1-1 TaxID=2651869 RepID=UPI0021F3F0C1|nr:hypothetical protein [Streptomyces sp. SS1-1]